jgi:hypothetical protein
MSISFRLLSTLAVLGSAFWACAPDLDALSSKYDPNAAGTGGNSAAGSGGTTSGTGGDTPETGGTSAAAGMGTGGDGTGGTEAGAAGQAGEGEGATGGTDESGGSSGTGGTGGSTSPPGSCSNGTADSNETDIDCGGSSKCERCDVRQHCGSNSDCLDSLFCKNGRCAEPTCSDNVQNGDETGVDCGGACALDGFSCDDGIGCSVNRDCSSEFCSSEVCTDHCLSNKREADETDVDCGGKQCAACGDDKKCSVAADCASKICTNKLCVPATCDDGVLNQNESDTDCGGVCTPSKYCALTQPCNSGADCESYVCNSSGTCDSDLTIPTGDLIDNFEDGNFNLMASNGRAGNWYFFSDQTATATSTWAMAPIDGQRGPTSLIGQHATGEGFTNWGCGVGVDLSNTGGGQASKKPYNASFDDGGTLTPYAGITFWARASGTLSVGVVFPDGDTDAAGGICNQTGTAACGENPCACDHHYLTVVSLGTEWKRYTVAFSDLQLEGGTNPVPGPFDPTRLVSVQFRVAPNATFDFWVDDVAFVRPQ